MKQFTQTNKFLREINGLSTNIFNHKSTFTSPIKFHSIFKIIIPITAAHPT